MDIIKLYKEDSYYCISINDQFWSQSVSADLARQALENLIDQLEQQGRKYDVQGSIR